MNLSAFFNHLAALLAATAFTVGAAPGSTPHDATVQAAHQAAAGALAAADDVLAVFGSREP